MFKNFTLTCLLYNLINCINYVIFQFYKKVKFTKIITILKTQLYNLLILLKRLCCHCSEPNFLIIVRCL